jgi:hypothetical protein
VLLAIIIRKNSFLVFVILGLVSYKPCTAALIPNHWQTPSISSQDSAFPVTNSCLSKANIRETLIYLFSPMNHIIIKATGASANPTDKEGLLK